MKKLEKNKNIFIRNKKKIFLFNILVIIFFIIGLDYILFNTCTTFKEKIHYLYKVKKIRCKHPIYHHGFKPSSKERDRWGPYNNYVFTNSLGLKDKSIRRIEPKISKYRLLFIGDSFTEGIGLPYEETFVGLIDKNVSDYKIEVLNAGVGSYSPKLYYLKIRDLVENKGIKINELYTFLDLSDIEDELEYDSFQPQVSFDWELASPRGYSLKSHYGILRTIKNEFLLNFSLIYYIVRKGKPLWPLYKFLETKDGITLIEDYEQERFDWPIFYDDKLKKWPNLGIELSFYYMDLIAKFCQKNEIFFSGLAVYPWAQEVEKNNIDSVHIKVWRGWTHNKKINFLNCYPPFFQDRAKSLKDYYIKGDYHFNSQGNKIIAKEWLKQNFERLKEISKANN